MTHRSRRRSAFTLIEVLLALMLILALTGGMMSYIWGLLGSRDRLVTATDQQISAAALFEQLESDLSTTFAADGSGAAGVKGTGTSLTVRSRGVGSLAGGGVNDLGDLQGCEVRFESGAVSARRLGRAEQNFEQLGGSVERLRFRYFDGKEWAESFDSAAAGALPVAVEVGLWFATESAPASADEAEGADAGPLREPDRLRVIVVPDGPVTSWKSHL